MKKKCKVVMLPTEKQKQHSSLQLVGENNKLYNSPNDIENDMDLIDNLGWNQHLYILSDEEIKEGDCFLGFKAGEIQEEGYWVVVTPQNKKEYVGSGVFVKAVKIIATTNPELYTPEILDSKGNILLEQQLPKIYPDFIEAFIKEYNAGNPITEIMVEYKCNWCDPEESKQQCKTLITQGKVKCDKQLKLRSDNTIYITKAEEKMYSREDVEKLLWKSFGQYAGSHHSDEDGKLWIKNQLS